jgi:2-C-methyl-D-erythritol 2,4-cyclodiphosphate synthase
MQVNIKARTHEKVDSIGEGRALSCHAVLIMEKK